MGGPQAYSVLITMAAATVQALSASGMQLHVLLGVQSADKATLPTVWMQLGQPYQNMAVKVVGTTLAFTAGAPMAAGQTVRPGFSVQAGPGSLLTVDQAGGSGEVTNDCPVPAAVGVLNSTTTGYVTGLEQTREDGSAGPICAGPLYGNGMQLIVPLAKMLLAFSSVTAAPGTPVQRLYGPGVLVDASDATQRPVSFDINQGWSWGGYSWAQSVASSASVVRLLVEPSAVLADAAAEFLRR
jgi:hypothetical protein